MRRALIAVMSALALGGVMAADEYDGSSWVYTPETYVTTAPVTAESSVANVDNGYWSSDWNRSRIYFKLGLMVLFW